MAIRQPGETIAYTVTFLEMTHRPTAPLPPVPVGPSLALVAASSPPAEYFLFLYRAVGAEYEWTDWLDRPREDLDAMLAAPEVSLFTLIVDGVPGGFFLLDAREAGVCDLAYFGLAAWATGRRLGAWLLGTAIDAGWDLPGVEKMTVNTNTLDHPRALALYQRMGFAPVRREERARVLTRPRGE